jgi:hypothetical protein
MRAAQRLHDRDVFLDVERAFYLERAEAGFGEHPARFFGNRFGNIRLAHARRQRAARENAARGHLVANVAALHPGNGNTQLLAHEVPARHFHRRYRRIAGVAVIEGSRAETGQQALDVERVFADQQVLVPFHELRHRPAAHAFSQAFEPFVGQRAHDHARGSPPLLQRGREHRGERHVDDMDLEFGNTHRFLFFPEPVSKTPFGRREHSVHREEPWPESPVSLCVLCALCGRFGFEHF